MKRRLSIFAAVLAAFLLAAASSAPDNTPQGRYIARYAPIAVSEMYRSGIPASITLAQGLLESRYGLSELAAKGNNHFGIKCHDWKGKSMKVDDDRKGECFRVYDSYEQSFRDHSDFLRYRDRYKFLFDNDITDYKAWAYGLKKAGYATDPAYPQKLIRLIEDYDLSRYDRMTPKQAEEFVGKAVSKGYEESQAQASQKTMTAKEAKKARKEAEKARKEAEKARKKAEKNAKKEARKRSRSSSKLDSASEQDISFDHIPESPLSIEEPKKISARTAHETYTFSLSRQLYSRNGVPFIYACEGEDLSSIAKANNLFVRELRKFNDAPSGWEPRPGEIVYLQSKKKQGAKDLAKYIVEEDGENLRAISQRFGVRLDEIRKMNSFSKDHELREGDTVLLRK